MNGTYFTRNDFEFQAFVSTFSVTLPLLAADGGSFAVAVNWGDGQSGNQASVTAAAAMSASRLLLK